MANSRYLYLPAVGWAIVWGAVVGSIDQPQRRAWLAVWMVAWNLTMLRHDLAFWLRVPAEARQVCADFGATVVARQESVIVSGLPSRKDGVVFLANGFAECVSMNSGAAVWRVKVGEPANYRWNAEQGKISAAN